MNSKSLRWILIGLIVSCAGVAVAQPMRTTPFPSTEPASEFGPAPAADENPMAIPRKKPDGRFQIQLKDGSAIIGTLSDKLPLKITTAFGEVAIPLKDIAVIEFNADSPEAKVTLQNGDRISGELSFEKFNLKTAWAELEIEAKHLARVTSNDLACNSAVRRAVAVILPDGSQSVQYVEEFLPAESGATESGYRDPIREPSALPRAYYPAPPGAAIPLPARSAPATIVPSPRRE